MEEEPISQGPRSKGTKEHLASLREQSKAKETENEREEEEPAATFKGKIQIQEKRTVVQTN